jgi:putative DNA primase/helicase
VGNSRLVFAVCVAFAAVLIRLLKLEGGGFHYFGSSSGGKTTALFVSASVQSDPKVYIQRWRATGNGLEGMAKLHNDANLILDELGEIDPREAGNCSYLLANGGGKIRSKTSGDAKQPALWTLYFLSAGEITLAEHMAEGGKQAKAGQEIRCVDIPADAGEGLGLFETIHGFESPAKFADALKLNTQEHHGFALVPFIEAVINNKDELIPKVREYIDNFIEFCVPKGASGQISRVATRFALVAAAGEFASAMGITGWAELEAEKAAITCFNAWLGNRDHFGNQEELRTISQIRGYLQTYGDSRFVTARYTSVKLESLDTRTLSRRDGYKIVDGENNITAFYILPDAFTNDVCSGLNINTTIKYLAEKEYLKKDSEGKNQQAKRLPGLTGQARIYHVDASILNT